MRTLGVASLLVLAACGPKGGAKGECRDALLVGDLVITEVFADFKAPTGGTGADEGKEWFEIYNASDRPVELEGMRIDHSRPDGSKLESHIMEPVTIAPGQYFTLGNATPDLIPAYIDYGYADTLGDFFNSDGGKLSLNCGTALIDEALYESIKEGRARQLTSATFPDYTLNDDPTAWCESAGAEFEEGNFGTPGAENDCTPVISGVCNDGGTMRPTVSPMPGELVITEIMADPAGTDGDQEWFEVKALAAFDLNGLTLDRASEAGNADTIDNPDCLHMEPGDYAVFAGSIDPALNGGLPAGVVKATFGFTLTQGTVATPGDIQILAGATLIDSVTYTDSTSGVSLSLDPDLENATDNDQFSNFCAGVGMYGPGGAGTPGADNAQCTLLPPAGMCDDGGTIRAIVKPGAGALVITEFLADPVGTDTNKEWFEIVNTSGTAFDLNELTVSRSGATATVVTSAACISIAPGAFGVFARSSNPMLNGGIPKVDATFGFDLTVSGANRNISVADGVTVLDTIAWTGTGQGATSSVATGKSTQLDPDGFNTTANDLMNPAVGGLVCQGAGAYGTDGDVGTPGTANAQCP